MWHLVSKYSVLRRYIIVNSMRMPADMKYRRKRTTSSLFLLVACGPTIRFASTFTTYFLAGKGVYSLSPTYQSFDRRGGASRCLHFSSSATTSSSDPQHNLPPEIVDYRDGISNLPRIYVDTSSASTGISLSPNALVKLPPNQSNYLNVMRITNTKRWRNLAGYIRIFNGKDGEWLARVLVSDSSASSKRPRRRKGGSSPGDATVVECVSLWKAQPLGRDEDSTPKVRLYIGRLKKQRRRWILEKATELGVEAIHAIDTEYAARTDAWEYDKHVLQIIEAAEQCERLTLPFLNQEPLSWDDQLKTIEKTSSDSEHQWLVCRERSPESMPIAQALLEASSVNKPIAYNLLVGPEGGWSPKELEDLQEIQKLQANLRFVSLGCLVLRAETAAIAGISAAILFQEKS